MTGFFEIFNPGLRHTREQKDFDKVAVIPTRKGGRGPLQIDLEAGTVVLPNRRGHLSEDAITSAAAEPSDEAAADDVSADDETAGTSAGDEGASSGAGQA